MGSSTLSTLKRSTVIRLGNNQQQQPKLKLCINTNYNYTPIIKSTFFPVSPIFSFPLQKFIHIFPQVAECLENNKNICSYITEYVNVITINNINTVKVEFSLDYTNIRDNDNYAIAHIYSHKDKSMLIRDWLIKAGEKSTLLRYHDSHNCFKPFYITPTIMAHNVGKKFRYSIMVTTGGNGQPFCYYNSHIDIYTFEIVFG